MVVEQGMLLVIYSIVDDSTTLDFFGDSGYYTIVPKLLVPGMAGATDGDGFIYS